MATQLPTMHDHADELHPLTTQPDRQMDPARAAAAAEPAPAGQTSGKAFMEKWKQVSSVDAAKAKMRERGY